MSRFLAAIVALLLPVVGITNAVAQELRRVPRRSHRDGGKGHRLHQEERPREGVRRVQQPEGAVHRPRLYVVVYDMNGKVHSHGANAKMIGKNVLDLRDVDGKHFVKERVEMMSKGPDAKGWQDYKFMNPVSARSSPSRCICTVTRS